MSDDRFATDEQLERIERDVLRRLDRRAAVGRALARGAVAVLVVGLLGGGIALLHPGIGTSTSGAASGSSADRGGSSEGSASRADRTVRCHVSSDADSRYVVATLGSFSLPSVTSTCRQALAGPAPSAASASPGPSEYDVLCRDVLGRLHAFPGNAHPQTQCLDNGMHDA